MSRPAAAAAACREWSVCPRGSMHETQHRPKYVCVFVCECVSLRGRGKDRPQSFMQGLPRQASPARASLIRLAAQEGDGVHGLNCHPEAAPAAAAGCAD